MTRFQNYNILLSYQTPFLPENELSKNVKFIEKFSQHLEGEATSMELENGEKCKGKELVDTYKYIFNSPIDFTGPLNYFRNFMFYRVKANLNLR